MMVMMMMMVVVVVVMMMMVMMMMMMMVVVMINMPQPAPRHSNMRCAEKCECRFLPNVPLFQIGVSLPNFLPFPRNVYKWTCELGDL